MKGGYGELCACEPITLSTGVPGAAAAEAASLASVLLRAVNKPIQPSEVIGRSRSPGYEIALNIFTANYI